MIDLSTLSNEELLSLKHKVEYEISEYSNQQTNKKVQLNSAYGALGNEYFRFFDIRLAEAVTYNGKLVILWIEKALNEYLNKRFGTINSDFVIAVDTDSVYIKLGKFAEELSETDKFKIVDALDEFCKTELQSVINASYKELATYLNCYENRMKMKREVIADRGIWTAKKRYCLHVYNSEGVSYAEPKLKIMGSEAVRSSVPSICRETIKKFIKLLFVGTQEDVFKFVNDFEKKFKSLPPDQVAFPRTANGLSKYLGEDGDSKTPHDSITYKNKTPIQVKASYFHNAIISSLGLEKQYPMIYDGDKIKFIYLKTPNKYGIPVIGFKEMLPKEFGLTERIDYDAQFEKTFLNPVQVIAQARGWQVRDVPSVLSLFE